MNFIRMIEMIEFVFVCFFNFKKVRLDFLMLGQWFKKVSFYVKVFIEFLFVFYLLMLFWLEQLVIWLSLELVWKVIN